MSMLGELNKVFDRNFVIGHVVPALVFVGASVGLASAFGVLPNWITFEKQDALKDTTVIALAVLVVAIILLAVNRESFRLLEGYWLWPFSVPFVSFYRRRFRKLQDKRIVLDAEFDACEKNGQPFAKRDERRRIHLKLSTHFPREEFILPTSFGNTVRAFEDYSMVMYGFESIQGWSRLQAVMPKEFLEVVNATRATTDLWVNLWSVSLLLSGIYALMVSTTTGTSTHWWVPVACIVAALLASWRARGSAERWGEYVKSAFDVYLPELCRKMGYTLPDNHDDARKFWLLFSQAIVFRNAGKLLILDAYRKQDAAATIVTSVPPVACVVIDVEVSS